MKPNPAVLCLLHLSHAAKLAVYAIYLAGRKRGLMSPSERLAEATRWQNERLFWGSCYASLSSAS